ncbi:MAG: CheR family methyltransferase [Candidatus Poribacteria bacterium]
MTNNISDALLSQVSEVVAAQMGLRFPKERWRDLKRGIDSASREFGFKAAESCLQQLVSSRLTKKQIEILASYLTVGETYFFREKRSFEILEKRILPELIRSRRRNGGNRLRIWSAGCCTGEEPYSIAILLSKMIDDLQDWDVTILGTDINPRFLKKASEGIYKEWSFRGVPPAIKEGYFKHTDDGRFEILPDIKKMVTFSYLNLAEDTYPALANNTTAIDIIFCRNVLIYFAPEQAKRAIQAFHRSLVNGGWLVVSPSETSCLLHSPFITVNFPGAIFYKKEMEESQTAESSPPKKTVHYAPHDKIAVALSKSPEFVVSIRPYGATQSKRLLKVDSQSDNRGLEERFSRSDLSHHQERITETAPPNDLYLKAAALYEQGRYAEAEGKLIELFSKDSNNPKAVALLARTYANQGKIAESLAWCEKAIAADKLNPALHYLHATILQEQGRLEKAAMSLKRALFLDQNFALAHFALGNIARQQGRFDESGKHFENALSLLSNHQREEILQESEVVTVGRLMEIIRLMINDGD